ncbi:MAG TPA: hypothetical protein VGO52_23820 [Hyphomonadaceae bacterium]|jgi:hypothetical protein|nr:hypothetical protein [Hyphomonadaceae bacterium]
MEISSISTSAPMSAARGSAYSAETARKITAVLDFAAIILDEGGKYSKTQKADAYGRMHDAAVMGDLAGVSEEDRKTFESALVSSDTGKQMIELQRQMGLAMKNAANGSSGRGGIQFYDSLSADDQHLISQWMNLADSDGKRPFADMEALRTSWLAQATMYEHAIGVATAGRPDAEQVAPLLEAWNKGNIDDGWARAVLKLFQQPTDRVDLSAEAKDRLGPQQAGIAAPATAQRSQGSFLDTSV